MRNRNSLGDSNSQPHQLNQNRMNSGKKKQLNGEENEKQAFINRLTTQKALGKKKISTNIEYNNRIEGGGGRDVFNVGVNDKGIGIKHQPGQKKQRDFVIRKTNLHH